MKITLTAEAVARIIEMHNVEGLAFDQIADYFEPTKPKTKGELIEEWIITSVTENTYFDRNYIAREVGCTVSRIAEVLRDMSEAGYDRLDMAMRYKGLAETAKAEAKERRAAVKADAKAAKKAEPTLVLTHPRKNKWVLTDTADRELFVEFKTKRDAEAYIEALNVA